MFFGGLRGPVFVVISTPYPREGTLGILARVPIILVFKAIMVSFLLRLGAERSDLLANSRNDDAEWRETLQSKKGEQGS